MNLIKTISILFVFLIALFLSPKVYSQCNETEVTITTSTVDYADEMSWELYDSADVLISSFEGVNNNETTTSIVCLPDGCYYMVALDSYGDGWNGGTVSMVWNTSSFDVDLPDGEIDYASFGINETDCILAVPGCTDPNALNYNPSATEDDGSCQILSDIIAAQVFDTLCYSGPKDNRISWVFQNRGVENANNNFTDAADFSDALMEELIPAFTNGIPEAQTPYAEYKNFFNLYAAWWPDAPGDHSWWNFNLIQSMRDEIFLPWANEETGWVTWFSTTQFGGGGGAGLNRDARVGDGKMFGTGYETLLHEFGHTMPGLFDEYTASGEWSNGQCFESANTTGYTIKDSIPWRNWIEDDVPLPTPYNGDFENVIAAFEGSLTNYFGCHRPTAKGCYMGAGGFGEGYGEGLCAPCTQRVICFLYQYVNVIENPTPASPSVSVTGSQTMTFSADVVAPEPNTQKYEWFLNGKLVAEDVTTVELTFGSCDEYELKFAVTDTTDMVRYDEKFKDIYPKPYREFIWTIDQEDVGTYDLSSAANTTAATCTGENNGAVALTIDGGAGPYEIWWNGTSVNNPTTGLNPGNHLFTIVDANGCSVNEDVEIEQADLLDLEICASQNGTWEVTVNSENYDLASLELLWSTGATTPMITGLANGAYSLTATINGCSVTENFELISSTNAMSISEEYFPSELNKATGSIYVAIAGGVPAYQIQWFEKLTADRTDDNNNNITTSGSAFGHLPEMAFDDDLGTKWLDAVSNNAWVGYEFPIPTTISSYAITSADDVPGRDPQDWTFEGSNDGSNWTVLDTRVNEDFPNRFQRKAFPISNTGSYTYYRLFVSSGAGANEIQLQELEFIGINPADPFLYNAEYDGYFSRTQLAPGEYRYEVSDASSACAEADIMISVQEGFVANDLTVIQNGNCAVAIEFPNSNYNYRWLSDAEGTAILGSGESFEPPYAGNFYVVAIDNTTNGWSSNRKGFAVTMPLAPQIEELGNGTLAIIDPSPDEIYHWYDADACGTPVHVGETFMPGPTPTQYFIAAMSNTTYPDAIDPNSVDGLSLRMDASDLDGDGQVDNPAPETSSILDWYFPTGNNWDPGTWFAYRSNYQNGLGIADWATLWLQGIQEPASGYQTVIMAYEENELSWENTAPFEALSEDMPRHSDASQLYANNSPATTLDGRTFLNGEEVDPLSTSNPMAFCVLGSAFTEPSGQSVYYTDVHWEGKVGEILFYNNALSDEDMKGVSEYLRKKWISTAELESPRTPFQWGVVSTTEIEEGFDLRLSPNPANDVIVLQSEITEPLSFRVFDLQGRLIYYEKTFMNSTTIDISSFASGLYQVVARSQKNEVRTLRFVKL